jgi:hypothetical protein
MPRHVVAAVVALCLVLAACSTSAATDGASTAGGPAAEQDQVASPTISSTTVPFQEIGAVPPGGDGIATAPLSPEAVSPTTTELVGDPVTTINRGGGGDTSIYRGMLGALGPDEVVAPAVVDPPRLSSGVLPLTGQPGVVPFRPAAVVKIDNSPAARPQTGLNGADIVVEEEVEGGLTRFAAIFHSQSGVVGPVRSGRTTDIGVLASLGQPLLLYSGANLVTDTILRDLPNVQNRSFDTSSGYWRGHGRAPSNLYSDTGSHWASAEGGPPPAQFAFRHGGQEVDGLPVSELSVAFRGNKVRWTWDEGGEQWLRHQGGSAHTVFSGDQVSAANVVVIEAREVATGMVDAAGSTVPEFVFVGTGSASVFTAGHQIDGIWTRPTVTSVATLTTPEGEVIELTPGRTWIELVRADAGLASAH